MNIVAVADTHTALWYLYDDPRLSFAAGTFLDDAVAAGRPVGVSAITLVEIAYLVERRRVPSSAFEFLSSLLNDPNHFFIEIPVTIQIADTLRQVSRIAVPDMPDRIIAATDLHFGVPVISRDSKIRAAAIQTIW
jgi:PIN domain nuclease of toxin-antitoxin system